MEWHQKDVLKEAVCSCISIFVSDIFVRERIFKNLSRQFHTI